MWKIGTALGTLALFASPAAVGQEKPKILELKPIVVGKAGAVVLNAADREVWLRDGKVAFSPNWRWIARRGSKVQPLMFGGLGRTVERMEKLLEDAPSDDVKAGLAAVDAIEKAVMEARRVLRTERFALEEAAEQVVASQPSEAEYVLFLRRALDPTITALQKAWGVARDDVSTVRQAVHLEEVGQALDEVEKSLLVLRTLFWEKASKRD